MPRDESENPLEFSVHGVSSTLRVNPERELRFERCVLSVRNTGPEPVSGLTPHATVVQERGQLHDVSGALARAVSPDPIPPGGTVEWDLYDLLMEAHPGVASKIHLWGYKAILEWWIELAAWAEFRSPEGAGTVSAPVRRWRFRWTPATPAMDDVRLTVEPGGEPSPP